MAPSPPEQEQAMDSLVINEKAAALVKQLAEGCTKAAGFSSFSTTVYDTAWVAMVTKNIDGETRWLFPECFQFLLANQMDEGGWKSYASEVDGILNTMAALLALKMHADAPQYQDCTLPEDIQTRISKCRTALQGMLDHWDVEACIHVGFEILVPSLLQLLRESGLSFNIPGEKALMALNHKKLARFDPRMLYQKACTTLIHSLEAFIGRIDFDRVSQHRAGGSMMGSPASTAAYLMHSSRWDDEAERYLSMVVASIKGKEHGGVPSAFPATTFMLSWAISTLLNNVFTLKELGWANMRTIADFLERELENGNGLVGFAPGFLEDADDTAKTLLSLHVLGRPRSLDAMIATFESEDHFKTFQIERNPSFSANCNILHALLFVPEPKKYAPQILKATVFLCDLWYNGDAKDKWNLAKQYSRMLLAQALTRLLFLWDTGALDGELEVLIQDRIPIILTQILVRTLQDLDLPQCSEASAYAVLTLTSISSLPWFSTLGSQISGAIEKGKKIVHDAVIAGAQPEYLWVEKVTYSSSILRETYCLAALKAQASSQAWGEAVQSLAEIISIKKLTKFTHFFSQLPLFSKVPRWQLQASLIEGYLFYPRLKSISLDVFPRRDMAKDDYLEYIPLTWTLCNNNQKTPLHANFLWDMMVISMLNYQADEYMEAVIGEKFANDLTPVKQLIHHLCETTTSSTSNNKVNTSPEEPNGDQSNGTQKKRPHSDCDELDVKPSKRTRPEAPTPETQPAAAPPPHPVTNGSAPDLSSVSPPLSRFIRHILTHPHISQASAHDLATLRHELLAFLLAHITQIEDNVSFASQNPPSSQSTAVFHTTPDRSYFTWIHTTSAIHTSCPYSFAFVACLAGSRSATRGSSKQRDCFPTALQKYLGQALVRHLSAMCRQYNDYGSIDRDRAEGNVNSVNFGEFHDQGGEESSNRDGDGDGDGNKDEDEDGDGDGEDEEEKVGSIKEALFAIAGFERECLGLAQRRLLLETLGPAGTVVGDTVALFVDVTDLYGQVYVARDIASRMR